MNQFDLQDGDLNHNRYVDRCDTSWVSDKKKRI